MGENYPFAILFLDRSGFDFYTPTQESTIRLNFQMEIFRDMEIINNEQFIAQISSFITTYSIPPSAVTIVVANSLLFIKDILITNPSEDQNVPTQVLDPIEQQKIIKNFLDTVPFELVESKTYPIDGGVRVVAVNKALYESIKTCFEKEGSFVKAIVPSFIFPDQNQLEGLTEALVGSIVKNEDALLGESFVVDQEQLLSITPEEKKKEFMSLPKQQTKLYVMGGGFLVLALVFGVMFKQMLDQNADINKKPSVPSPTQTTASQSTPTGIPLGSIVATTAITPVINTKLRIEITVTSATAAQGQLIKNKLLEKGYNNIVTVTNTAIAAKTLIIFSSSIDPSTQQDITNVIKNIFTTFSSQVNTQSQFDVTIIPSANP